MTDLDSAPFGYSKMGMPRFIVGMFATATIAAVTLAACMPTKGQEVLPAYAHIESADAVRIDLEEASNGFAMLGERNQIALRYEEAEVRFTFSALSGAIELSPVALMKPPVKISPVLTPGDGVADLFAAVWMEGVSGELHIDVFLDSDWQEVVSGEISIHTQEIIGRRPQFSKLAFDFARGLNGVYHHELAFVDDSEFFLCVSPIIWVTNLGGETLDVVNAMARLDLQQGDVVVGIGVQGDEGCLQKSTGLAPGTVVEPKSV